MTVEDADRKPHYSQDKQSLFSTNARTYWIPATVVRTADHGSYIVKVIGGGEYRRARDHIRERHPDAVKPDKHTPMAVY